MAQDSKIQWTTHTFNGWRGCTKISPGCARCYAEKMSGRNPKVLGVWGDDGTRVLASESYWSQPLKWDRAAKAAGERHRVFCLSLGDVFERRPELVEWRDRLHALIAFTPNLDWLLLTKRPDYMAEYYADPDTYGRVLHQADQYWRVRFPALIGIGVGNPAQQRNRWAGTSVEDQKRADERIPHLLKCPAAVRFLSCEPLLGPVRLDDPIGVDRPSYFYGYDSLDRDGAKDIHWVIVGGESGHGARPCNVEWVRSIVGQCKLAGVACFVKQLGATPYVTDQYGAWPYGVLSPMELSEDDYPVYRVELKDKKGGDPSEWGDDLRVREFPKPAAAEVTR